MTKRQQRQKQYRADLEALGLSQVKAAHFLGAVPRTSRRWALGEGPIPETVLMLLRVMVKFKISPDEVEPSHDPLATLLHVMSTHNISAKQVERLMEQTSS